MKKIKYVIELMLLRLLFAIFKTMPLDMASFVGSFMARSIGPLLRAHGIAKKNLAMIFPKLSWEEQHKILWNMWDNLGRVAAELPHLPEQALHNRVKIHGLEHLPTNGKPVIFFSGHLGNWELSYPIVSHQGLPVTLLYRPANNHSVDEMIRKLRATQSADQIPKGRTGAIRLGRAIKNGHSLAMLVDQKMNEGIAVPFFGRDAMTAPAIAEFALRYDMPLIPGRIVRTHGCHFEATVYPALVYEKTGDEEKDVLVIMTQINALLESWIREHPAQWFWVHKRWPGAHAPEIG